MEEKKIKIFEGTKVILYISLDAGKRKTYAKLRNYNFVKIFENLKKFKRLKKGKTLLPKTYRVFIPMKFNLQDLEDFFKLSKGVEASQIIFRPLNKIGKNRKPLVIKAEYKIPIVNQFFFGIEEKLKEVKEIPKEAKLDNIFIPWCKEPWESYYIFKRGIWLSSYGYGPIAKTKSFKEAWNSKEILEIRKALKEGSFSDYSLKSISCPLLQREAKKF